MVKINESGQPTILVQGVSTLTGLGLNKLDSGNTSSEKIFKCGHTESQWARVVKVNLEETMHLLPNRKLLRLLTRGVHLGLISALAALQDAKVNTYPCEEERLGVFAGGHINLEDLEFIHKSLSLITKKELDWRERFGDLGLESLPPLLLLRRLPNACFAHSAKLARARGYNGTLLDGPVSGLDCLRVAIRGISLGRLDAALIIGFDSPVNWIAARWMSSLSERINPGDTITLGEGGGALYIERSDLHPNRNNKPYARIVKSVAGQAKDALSFVNNNSTSGLNSIFNQLNRLAIQVQKELSRKNVKFIDVGGLGIKQIDKMEREAFNIFPSATIDTTSHLTGFLGNGSGAIGLVHIASLLSKEPPGTQGMVSRFSLTGQCAISSMESV